MQFITLTDGTIINLLGIRLIQPVKIDERGEIVRWELLWMGLDAGQSCKKLGKEEFLQIKDALEQIGLL